ncbi:MAG: hypothetical protein JRH17_25190 [Deltaproteobacteria bacterium]|nr:hypothetical protein [Deltaproteobacteria bacterium]
MVERDQAGSTGPSALCDELQAGEQLDTCESHAEQHRRHQHSAAHHGPADMSGCSVASQSEERKEASCIEVVDEKLGRAVQHLERHHPCETGRGEAAAAQRVFDGKDRGWQPHHSLHQHGKVDLQGDRAGHHHGHGSCEARQPTHSQEADEQPHADPAEDEVDHLGDLDGQRRVVQPEIRGVAGIEQTAVRDRHERQAAKLIWIPERELTLAQATEPCVEYRIVLCVDISSTLTVVGRF